MATRSIRFLQLRRPTRANVELAAKAGLSSGLAIWLGNRIGLSDSYWGGISAVVATAGTLGASVGAALSRISATIVGLLLGVAALALPVSGTVVAGITVFVALVVLPALSLDTGARLGAATTLIVTAIPGHHAIGDALSRGANVPLGCAIAVLVGVVLFPHRAGATLRTGLRADVQRAGRIAQDAVLAYADKTPFDEHSAALTDLTRSAATSAVQLRDAAREPGGRGGHLLALQQSVGALESLVHDVRSLVTVVAEAGPDDAPALVAGELRAAAHSLAAAAAGFEAADGRFAERLGQLTGMLAAVDTALAGARARRATVEFGTDELVRLLSVVRLLNASRSALSRLAVDA